MPKSRYLIDSCIAIDQLNGIKKANDWFLSIKDGEAVVSVITRAETLAQSGSARDIIKNFLNDYDCLNIDSDIADIAADLRDSLHLKLPDAFQLALARKHDLIFVTRDKKDFSKLTDSAIFFPYTL